MAARGRPKGIGIVITEAKQKEILAILTIGGSRNDAADYVGVGKSTLHDTIARDADFAEQIKKAEAAGKIRHMRKIDKASQWQASAWFLERKYPAEFGNRPREPESVAAPTININLPDGTRYKPD